MKTYLLAWNPNKFPQGTLEDELNIGRSGDSFSVRWSVGNNKQIQPGDRIFLIRLGKEPRGIVGSGVAKSSPYIAPHWNPTQAESGATTKYIDLIFDMLTFEPLISIEDLKATSPLNGFRWSTQMSGVSVPDSVAAALEDAWALVGGHRELGFPDQLVTPAGFVEGAAMKVLVNKYERNPAARRACLNHHGYGCSVCGMTFKSRYGPIAASLIQVHHLTPLSAKSGEDAVDPVNDLRPLCPNCHTVVHLSTPPLTIEQAKDLLTGDV